MVVHKAPVSSTLSRPPKSASSLLSGSCRATTLRGSGRFLASGLGYTRSLSYLALVALALLTVCSSAVKASTIDVDVNDAGFHQYQQTTNSPCIFGESNCQNPSGFDYASGTGGGISSYSLAESYTVGQLTQIAGDFFYVGLDINQTSDPQTLQVFTIAFGDALTYALPSPVSVPSLSNGTGYADYYLSAPNKTGFSLLGLDPNSIVTFRTTMDPANDGGEQFYVLAAPAAVPEPISTVLVSSGMLGLFFLYRRKPAPFARLKQASKSLTR